MDKRILVWWTDRDEFDGTVDLKYKTFTHTVFIEPTPMTTQEAESKISELLHEHGSVSYRFLKSNSQ